MRSRLRTLSSLRSGAIASTVLTLAASVAARTASQESQGLQISPLRAGVCALASLPDLNGDGRADLAWSMLVGDMPAVFVVCGATGETLRKLDSPSPDAAFGYALACTGTCKERGKLFVGAPSEAGGTVLVWSLGGKFEGALRPAQPAARFGASLLVAPDTNGDGVDEVLVGAPSGAWASESERGSVECFDGATLRVLWNCSPSAASSAFGSELGLGRAGDAAEQSVLVAEPGVALHRLDAKSGSVLLRYVTKANSVRLASACAEVDLGGGRSAVFGVAESRPNANAARYATLVAWDARSGDELHAIEDVSRSSAWRPATEGESLFARYRLHAVGDVDADGVEDLLVAASSVHTGLPGYRGQVDLVSIRCVRVLREAFATGEERAFGFALAPQWNGAGEFDGIFAVAPDFGLYPAALESFDADLKPRRLGPAAGSPR
jgi:hypothetical protein